VVSRWPGAASLAALAEGDPHFSVHITLHRYINWGHSLRDLGIRRARGRYLLPLNPDNPRYPQALASLQACSQRQAQTIKAKGKSGKATHYCINPDVLIYAIRLMGCMNVFTGLGRLRRLGEEATQQLILLGWPPQPFMIDPMQLVATREIWQAMGGCHDHSETSDGRLLAAIAKRYGYLVVPEILGEHW
jgi:hypothetical protein